MKKTLKILIIAAGTALLLFGVLLFFTFTAYRPEEKAPPLTINDPDRPETGTPGALNIISWNTGYSGLNRNTDSILEGGTMSLPESPEAVTDALKGIGSYLEQKEADIYFLQEVDLASQRSFDLDQTAAYSLRFPDYFSWYARNYKVKFVPYPLKAPLGRMDSGLLTLSRYESAENIRYALPGRYSWPVRLFHLSRCALFTRIPSAVKGKDWCLFNVHLSAYGDGSLRKEQLEYLKNLFLELEKEGHFVVAGGDWNSLFPGVEKEDFAPYTTAEEHLGWLQRIPEEWTMEGWQWAYDPAVPTARSLDQPYRRGENFETIIDGFLVSPNLEVLEIRGTDLFYDQTDHNPVSITLSIK